MSDNFDKNAKRYQLFEKDLMFDPQENLQRTQSRKKYNYNYIVLPHVDEKPVNESDETKDTSSVGLVGFLIFR